MRWPTTPAPHTMPDSELPVHIRRIRRPSPPTARWLLRVIQRRADRHPALARRASRTGCSTYRGRGSSPIAGASRGATAWPHRASSGHATEACRQLEAHQASPSGASSWNGMQEVWGSKSRLCLLGSCFRIPERVIRGEDSSKVQQRAGRARRSCHQGGGPQREMPAWSDRPSGRMPSRPGRPVLPALPATFPGPFRFLALTNPRYSCASTPLWPSCHGLGRRETGRSGAEGARLREELVGRPALTWVAFGRRSSGSVPGSRPAQMPVV
jgi:hypothetical protein